MSRLTILGLLALLCCWQSSFAKPDDAGKKADLTQERKEAFAWLDGLDYPDVKNLQFVRVAVGHARTTRDGKVNTFVHGFLIESKANGFHILSSEIEIDKYTPTPPETLPHDAVYFEEADFRKHIVAVLKVLDARTKKDFKESPESEELFRDTRVSVFALSWFCSRRGMEAESARLYVHARNERYRDWRDDSKSPKSLQEKVADHLAYHEIWRSVLAFRDLDVSRSELQTRFDRFAKNFPKSEHHARAVETAKLLKQMVKEDDEHAARRKDGKPLDQLSEKERASELVFRLRDQTGVQWSQPGWCDIFWGNENTPAHHLVALGYDAVPALMEVLDDKRFTRAVGFHRNFYFSHSVLTVGECADTILERIAGISFRTQIYAKDVKSKDDKERRRAEMRAWYAELQKKGEKRLLIEATERGDAYTSSLAHRLVERYPGDAFPALLKGAKAAKDSTRATLVGLIGDIKNEESLQFLLTELKDGPYAQARLEAARSLHGRGRPEGLGAMIKWWHESARPRKKDDKQIEDPGEWTSPIVEFLAGAARVEAVQALGRDLRRRPVDVRLRVVEGLWWDQRQAKQDEKVAAAAEAVLIQNLDDTERRFGMGGSWNGKRFSDPRICDLAGFVLNQRDAQKYPFDLEAPLAERKQNIAVLRNTWRAANNLPVLPVPQPRVIEPVSAERLQPMLDRFLTGSADEKRAAQRDIEKLGLDVLPGVRDRLKSAKKVEQPRLDALAKRLATIVTEVDFSTSAVKPDAALVKRFEAMKDRPLDAKAFVVALATTLKAMPAGAHGLHVSAERAGDGTGFTLCIELFPGKQGAADAKGAPTRMDISEVISSGSNTGRSILGGSDASWVRKGEHPELHDALVRALATPPGEVIEVHLSYRGTWAK